jgi:replication-associated recombination protein RarA
LTHLFLTGSRKCPVMNNMLLNKNTGRQLSLVLKKPPHALLITGQPGSGKRTLAEYISSALLDIPSDKLFEHPYFSFIDRPEAKQEIPIEAIREAIRKLRLKPAAEGEIKRVVLIDGAHLMSTEAQNALLKAVEEPPPATAFVLTAISDNSVLPTIASRSQKLKIGSAGIDDALEYFKKDYKPDQIKSAWQLSGGAIGLLSALLREDDGHPLKAAVENAKQILKSSRYERALLLDNLSAKKAEFRVVLEALGRILTALHHSALASGNTGVSKRLIKARRQVDTALKSLDVNASPKLIALDLALNLTV